MLRLSDVTLPYAAQWPKSMLGVEAVDVDFLNPNKPNLFGFVLDDGRRVTVRIQEYSNRAMASLKLESELAEAGAPSPKQLASPRRTEGLAISIETSLPSGVTTEAPSATASGRAYARFTHTIRPPFEAAEMLSPSPDWIPPYGPDALMPKRIPKTPELRATAEVILDTLSAYAKDLLIGHSKWFASNLVWKQGQLIAVHGENALICAPDPMLAGTAATLHTAITPLSPLASRAETEEFLAAYAAERGTPWTEEELLVAWSASLWPHLYAVSEAPVKALPLDAIQERLATSPRLLDLTRLADITTKSAAN